MSDDAELSVVDHLIELRQRLIRAALLIGVLLLLLLPFSQRIYEVLARPLLRALPDGGTMIATGVVSPFFAPFKFTLVLALFLAMPYILHQLWGFVSPGLYRNEKRVALPILVSSVVLFYAGAAFAYLVVFPLVFRFMINAAPAGVAVMTDIASYLDFALKIFFAFGLAFEVPIVTLVLVLSGVTTAAQLASYRAYIIVVAFVLGMLLTPPDVISQVMLALPMWLLFELGLLLTRLLPVAGPTEDVAPDNGADAPGP